MDETHRAAKAGQGPRRHRSAEQRGHVERWRASGLTQHQYAQQHELSQKSLSRWSQRYRREERLLGSVGGGEPVFVTAEKPADRPGTVCWQLPGEGGSVVGPGCEVAVAIVGVLRALGHCP